MEPNADDVQARLKLAIDVGLAAGEVTLKYFGKKNFDVEWKADASPVTVADREAETILRSKIQAAFPEDGIVGEEFDNVAGSSGYRWILDPIDGTKSFIHGVPLYGTMIGVEFDGRSVVGMVLFPGLSEYIYASVGQGAWHVRANGEPERAKVSNTKQLDKSLFCATSVAAFATLNRGEAFQQLLDTAQLTRTWGDCYGYLLVATGRAEVMIDPAMNVWDAAALQPIMEESGGTFTDWNGEPTIHNNEGVATNSHVLEEVLAITRPL